MDNSELSNQTITQKTNWKRLIKPIYFILCGFGFISRQLIICSIGAVAYYYAPDILNIPFSSLTLGILLGSLLAASVILFCIVGFFMIPTINKTKDFDVDNEYIGWAKAGGFIILILFLIYAKN